MSTPPIRVLIVDDSALVRKLVTDSLKGESSIEVVGTAADPYIARDKIKQLKPDVMTLDLEMPRMDGLTFLKIVMEQHPMPVIIMSSLTQRGSDYALEAMDLGAFDVLAKPGTSYSFGDLGPQLISRIKATAGARWGRKQAPESTPPQGETTPAHHVKEQPPVVTHVPTPVIETRVPVAAPSPVVNTSEEPAAVPHKNRGFPQKMSARSLILLGSSTGGTEALKEVLTNLPDGMPGIAITQHIPPIFSRKFAERLNRLCKFQVKEAEDGDILKPGMALVAPGNFHLMLQWTGNSYRARVVNGPQVWHQRPAVDLLFKSAVDCGAAPFAVGGILTGMGRDGAEGLLNLRNHGAATFGQDQASSVVYGMPKAAWECGAVERQLPLKEMAEHIIRQFRKD